MSRQAARQAEAYRELLRVTVLENPYIPGCHECADGAWKGPGCAVCYHTGRRIPTPKQAEFLLAPEREVFYGGAVGGGKTEALLMAALQYVTVPGYNAILFRRTLTDHKLPDSLMHRANEWLQDTDAHWNGQDYRWTFPSGATLTFGYVRNAAEAKRYKSAQFQYEGWEEVTEQPDASAYTFLLSRLRRLKRSPIPIRSRLGSNPDGPGGEWVRDRFVPVDDEGNTRPQPQGPGGRRFIPAGLDDNPHLDVAEYEMMLGELDDVTYQQLRHGRFDVRNLGGMVDRSMFDWVTTDELPEGLVKWSRAYDLAATAASKSNPDPDWTVGLLGGIGPPGHPKAGHIYLLDMVYVRKDPGGVEDLARNTADMDGTHVRVGIPQDPGQAGKSQVAYWSSTVLPAHIVEGTPESGDKVTRFKLFAGAAKNNRIHVVRAPWNRLFISQVEAFPTKGVHDDVPDACSRLFTMLTGKATPKLGRI